MTINNPVLQYLWRQRYWLIIPMALILDGCQSLSSQPIVINAQYYQTDGTRYVPPKGVKQKDIVFVVIHGKSSSTDAPYLSALYQKLTTAGYAVVAPRMPWSSKLDGTFAQGISVIDSAVAYAAQNYKRVVLIGHSMGGSNVLYYASGKTQRGLVGIVTIAPAHMLQQSGDLLALTKSSVDKAREMESRGQGNEIGLFTEKSGDRISDIETTANIYLSYYDINMFPNLDKLINKINYPTYWVAGSRDPLTEKYGMAFLYDKLLPNPKNKYETLEGDHKSVVVEAADHIIQWVEQLQN